MFLQLTVKAHRVQSLDVMRYSKKEILSYVDTFEATEVGEWLTPIFSVTGR